MKVVFHTVRGTFVSKDFELTAEDKNEMMDMLKSSVYQSNFLSIESNKGPMILSKDVLQSSVIEVIE